jgi:threonyl-tRNA synthetase
MLVVGDREREAGEVGVREHRHGDEGTLSVEAFVARVNEVTKARFEGQSHRYTGVR